MKKVTKIFKKIANADPMIWGYVMLSESGRPVYAMLAPADDRQIYYDSKTKQLTIESPKIYFLTTCRR